MRSKSGFLAICVIVSGIYFAVQPDLVWGWQQYPNCYDVVWDSPSKDVFGSMPIGNGDIGLNVWAEQSGDIVLLLSKTDAFDENSTLLKLGRVRIKLLPEPLDVAGFFSQHLKLADGEIEIAAGPEQQRVTIRVWVDANRPVVHIESSSPKEFGQLVQIENWRRRERTITDTQVSDMFKNLSGEDHHPTVRRPDVIAEPRGARLMWYHHNQKRRPDGYSVNLKLQGLGEWLQRAAHPLTDRIFGAAVEGENFIAVDDHTLKAESPAPRHHFSVYALTLNQSNPAAWREAMREQIASVRQTQMKEARSEHRRWWKQFWDRSRLQIRGRFELDGNEYDAASIARAYQLCRYMNACAGRGPLPIKYNGSIFTTGRPDDPDFRTWGGPGFWFQNQRLVYWPMLASGDFDLMQPWFQMYKRILPLQRFRTTRFFGHDGAFFPETITFWGAEVSAHYGWTPLEERSNPVAESTYVRYYWQSGIEQMLMMFEYWNYTRDEEFAREILLPHAEAVTTFYDEHYQLDNAGHIHFGPASSLETWHVATNPVPEIAGLRYTLGKLLALPQSLTTDRKRQRWRRLRGEVGPLPTGSLRGHIQRVLKMAEQDGPGWAWPGGLRQRFDKLLSSLPHGQDRTIVLPAELYSMKMNVENPENYCIFPYRIYGLRKEHLQQARDTFAANIHPECYCWHQNDVQAALLGLTREAMRGVTARTFNYTNKCRFPVMFDRNHDEIPDVDHGGNLQLALQLMLMQCEGRKIIVAGAWPQQWDARFKLHAPMETVVQARLENGKVVELNVTPPERRKDIVCEDLRPPPIGRPAEPVLER